MGFSIITFENETLNIENMSVNIRQKTIKQTVGKNVVILGPALGVEANENVLTMSGKITSATKDTDKTNLKNLKDGQRHAYSDGIRSGDYAILSLNFTDTGGTAGISQYVYNMTLVEW